MEPPNKKMKTDEDLNANEKNSETNIILEEIRAYQKEIDSLAVQLNKEITQAEHKYTQLRNENFKKRNELIENVPHFWKTAILNHPSLCRLIHRNEKNVFNHLTKLDVSDTDNGYKIKFHFKDNPYFKNKMLVKNFHWALPHDTSSHEEIQWKSDQTIIQTCSLKNQQKSWFVGANKEPWKNKELSKSKKRKYQCDSFLSWYHNNNPECSLIGETIRGQLWHQPLQYFLDELNQKQAQNK